MKKNNELKEENRKLMRLNFKLIDYCMDIITNGVWSKLDVETEENDKKEGV